LRTFLDHVTKGKNYVTGKTGSPIDFITYHAKGAPKLVNGHVQMNMGTQLRDIDKGFEIVASYPTLKKLPIIIGESDPEGCAACSEDLHPKMPIVTEPCTQVTRQRLSRENTNWQKLEV
jgi:xylan 1,4-beta-xylosidase